MTQMAVNELTGPLLAEWVAMAWIKAKAPSWMGNAHYLRGFLHASGGYRPDINGGQAMELVRGFDVAFTPTAQDWQATVYNSEHLPVRGYGEEPEIAICRAVVAGEFGEFVEVEE